MFSLMMFIQLFHRAKGCEWSTAPVTHIDEVDVVGCVLNSYRNIHKKTKTPSCFLNKTEKFE